MSSHRSRLTLSLQVSIVAYIRAGGFPEIAAEAVGVPRNCFHDWMQQGESSAAKSRYRHFVCAVRQAHAQARLGAEVCARNDKPLDWLRYGPGRENSELPGWTASMRPVTAIRTQSPLAKLEIQALFQTLLQALGSFPEARMALANAAEKINGELPRQPPNR